MAYCARCGKELPEGSRFCTSCGASVTQAGVREPYAEPPAGSEKPRRQTMILAAVAVALVAAIVAMLCVIVSRSSSPSAEETATASSQKQSVQDDARDDGRDEAAQDGQDEDAQESDVRTAAADAYNKAIDEGDSYFGEWYGQMPDGELRYFLADLTGDDLPELVLSRHYSDVGLHLSGGERMIPLVYDASKDALFVAESSDFEMLYDPRSGYGISPDAHALIWVMRFAGRADTEWSRVYVKDDGTLACDAMEEGDWDALQPVDFTEATDRSPVDAMRDGTTAKKQDAAEGPAEQEEDSAQDVETERARLREEAQAQGLQVFTGTVRYTTVGDRANEVNPQLLSDFASSAGERMVLVYFDGAQPLTCNSGDGTGMRDGSTEVYEVKNPDEIGLVDGTRVCIGIRAEDASYSSSIRYELAPASGPATLVYTE